jgi:protein-S-isoprenylcysteine O-methyltransferase Ste14
MSTQKKWVERIRTRLSRVAGLLVFCFFALCGSKWDAVWSGVIKEVLAFAGLSLVSIAACGRLWCMLYIAGYKTQKLVIAGPYSFCRNPLYLFSLIGSIGMGMGSSTFTVPLIFIVAFSLYYPLTVKKEEDRLLLIHGEAYKTYCAMTPRYWPSFKYFNEPEQYTLDPLIFRKHVGNAVLWVFLFGLWEIFEYMRLEKWIPTLFNVW